MNVLSLFDGMSCGQVALKKSGILFDTYYASDIDKPAMSITRKNHPNTVFLGDVTKWREWDIDWASIGLLMGGSPCQGFSFAGKQLAFDDPRSALFFVYVDILNHIKSVNPNVKFLLENVRMKREFLDVITKYLGVEPVFINSALVSAQNRRRYYWANWNITIPTDRGVMLRDVLEDEPTNVTLMSDRFVKRQDGHRCLVNEPKEKATSLSAMEYVKNGRQILYIKEATKKGYAEIQNGDCFDLTFPTSKTRRGRSMKDKSNCLTAANYDFMRYEHPVYRKLTPVECERLQGAPDNYTEGVSNTQRYKMLGNGWQITTIVHIFTHSSLPRLMPGLSR